MIDRRIVIPDGEASEQVERLTSTPGAPLLTQTSLATSFSIIGLGSVTYDGFTLPLLRPLSSDRRIAVQSGARPSWGALLAKANTGADASSVSIYELSADETPELIVHHPGPLILGRTSTEAGVLVERPNPDGSRWIGLAPWDGTDIQWLVADKNVNAFAWMGSNGTLAFAKRSPEETTFKLVIHEASGIKWSLPESLPYSWILPVLDPAGDGLFALRLGDGYADLVWGQVDNAAFFRQTMRQHRTSDRVDMPRAWQMLAATTGGAGVGPGEIAWFSFELGRVVIWQAQNLETTLLPENSVAAFLLSPENNWLVTTTSQLELVAILQATTARTTIFDTPWIARGGSPESRLIVHASNSTLNLAELNSTKPTNDEK